MRGTKPDSVGSSGFPPQSYGDAGIGRKNTGNAYASWDGSNFKSSSDYTAISVILNSAPGGTQSFIDYDNSPRVFQHRLENGTDAQRFIGFIGGSVYVVDGTRSTSIASAFGPVVLGVTVNGLDVKVWYNGALDGSGTQSGASNAIGQSTITVCGNAANSQPFNGTLFATLILPVALPDAIMARLKSWRDVYDYSFQPRRIYIPTSTAAATVPTLSASTYVPGSLTSTGWRPQITAS